MEILTLLGSSAMPPTPPSSNAAAASPKSFLCCDFRDHVLRNDQCLRATGHAGCVQQKLAEKYWARGVGWWLCDCLHLQPLASPGAEATGPLPEGSLNSLVGSPRAQGKVCQPQAILNTPPLRTEVQGLTSHKRLFDRCWSVATSQQVWLRCQARRSRLAVDAPAKSSSWSAQFNEDRNHGIDTAETLPVCAHFESLPHTVGLYPSHVSLRPFAVVCLRGLLPMLTLSRARAPSFTPPRPEVAHVPKQNPSHGTTLHDKAKAANNNFHSAVH